MASLNEVIPANRDDLRQMYVGDQKSILDIAKILGTNYSRARKLLINAGVTMRSRAEAVRLVRHKIGASQRGTKRVVTDEWRASCKAAAQRRADATAKGVCLKPSGYLEYTRGPHKGRSVHVVLAELHLLGRRLRKGEHVHHKDENKTNNNIDNLEVLTISEHMRIHAERNHINRQRNKNGRFC